MARFFPSFGEDCRFPSCEPQLLLDVTVCRKHDGIRMIHSERNVYVDWGTEDKLKEPVFKLVLSVFQHE